MNLHRIQLYTKYLFGKITQDEFLEMRYYMNKTSDSEIEKWMENAWNTRQHVPEMPKGVHQQIKSNLDFYIEHDRKRKIRRYRMIAAAILFPLVACLPLFYFFNRNEIPAEVMKIEVESGQKASISLPDMSKVWLNSQTTLSYHASEKRYRKVSLDGEAFFNIEKNDSRPFILDLGEIQIEVLGTSFNAQTRSDENQITASLVTGKIKFCGKYLAKDYFLSPSEKFIYSKSNHTIRIIPTNSEYDLGWVHGRLTFQSESLKDIIRKIERWYGVSIDLQCPEIEQDLMTGSFYNEELKSVLEAIKIQYKINYQLLDNHVIINKKNVIFKMPMI